MRSIISVTSMAGALCLTAISLAPSPAAAQRFGGFARDDGGYRGYGFAPAFGYGFRGGFYGGYYARPYYVAPPVVYLPPPVLYQPPVEAYVPPGPVRRARPRPAVHHAAAQCIRLPAASPAAPAAPVPVPGPQHDVYPPEAP